ncbi:putative transcription factor WD40-like family [Helianthus annuus]|nr:putative transcription factor WD40-like family [Helianthus annuus]
MDGVNEPDENGKISNLLDPDAENKPLDESRKTGQTSWTKMPFYSFFYEQLLVSKIILFKHCFMFFFSVSINSSNTRMFVSGSCDATARLWDTRVASRTVRTFHGHEGDVNSVKFFPDGNRFGTGSDDGTCRLYDIRTGHQLQVYSTPQQQQGGTGTDAPMVTSIAFSISGRLLFAGYSNGDCFLWDTLLAKVNVNCYNFFFKF